jgi:cobalt-zinc-cadmium efflux system outer membrane protein
VPPITLPSLDPKTQKEREQAINRLFPPLPPLGANPQPGPGPEGKPLELTDLQRLAMNSSPVLRQAVADLFAARGAAVQAGLYPNPRVAFEGDSIGNDLTAGQLGAGVEQTIKTAGKLQLARAAAEMEVREKEQALQKTQAEVMSRVRAGYFAVLNAQESMRVALAFTRFAEELYRIQVEQLKGAQVAAYEPLQFRVLAVQARAYLVQARNRYGAAWKQLASALGLPDMPPAELAGRIDMPVPDFREDDVLARVLTRHSDVLAAEAILQKARYQLRLAQVTPIPDVDARVTVQRDHTSVPTTTTTNVSVGVPIPVWDRNQGAIRQAEGQLARAREESLRVRAELTASVGDAHARYATNRQLVEYYRTQILPDQVQVFRRIYERYHLEPDKINFYDVSMAQQNLANSIRDYLAALGELWTAAVDLARLLQTDDLFQVMGDPGGPAVHEMLPPPVRP